MKNIDVPTPHCKSCAKRKARSNPYERVENVLGWIGMLAIPVLLLGIVAAFVLMVMWGIETGQYGSTEVTETVNKPNNEWIGVVTFMGGLVGVFGIVMGFAFWFKSIGSRWKDQARKWDQRKMED